MSTDSESWVQKHIWVPVVVGVVIGGTAVALITWLICRYRQRRRYDYTALKDELGLPEKMELESQRTADTIRDTALMNLQFHLRSSWQYTVTERLRNIGSRMDKHWFIVKENKTRFYKLLTMSAKISLMPVPFTAITQKTLAELFLILQHPYLCPITVEFGLEQNIIITSYPLCAKGSLKDTIYSSKWTDPWLMKYSVHGKGISVKQAQTYGKQILQALLFLMQKGLPTMSHLHSGNIIIENGVCRLCGYENMFFGYKSRIYPLLKKKLKNKNKDAVVSAAFGHLLFEMIAGYEMDTAHPEPHHLLSCTSPVVQVLNYIFENPDDEYPSLEKINNHEFFHKVTLRELNLFNPAPIGFSTAMQSLVNSTQQRPSLRSKTKRQSSTASRPRDSTPESSSKRGAKQPGIDTKRSPPLRPPLAQLDTHPPTHRQAKSGSKSPPPTIPPKPPSTSTVSPPPPSMPSGGSKQLGATPPVKPPDNAEVVKEPVASIQNDATPKGRASLLSQIRKGAKLKKVRTNDRSVPKRK